MGSGEGAEHLGLVAERPRLGRYRDSGGADTGTVRTWVITEVA
ncbi:hypothetical protein [Kitasatospora aureofaciens]|nr:hypothetical protein [Kitasatospora aureofaciens]